MASFKRNDPHWSREEELAGQQFPTQVGRALEELRIQQIPGPLATSQRPH